MNSVTKKHEEGIALITVLFIFMITSLILMAILSRQRLDVERTGTFTAQAQAYAYARAAEELSRAVLVEDSRAMPKIDYLGQHWAQLKQGIQVENGTLALKIEDLQGRFNLNTLIDTDAAKARFFKLTKLVQLRDEAAQAVISALGTKTAPHLLTDITQLRTIPGILPEEATRLLPYVSALPERESELNVNTASYNVLRAYINDDNAYTRMIKSLSEKGFLTSGQLNAIGMNTKGMSVESHYFRLSAEAQIAGRNVFLTSIITRETDILGIIHIRIISRDLSGAL